MRIAFICTEKLPIPSIRGGAIQILIDGVTPHLNGKHELTIYCITDPDLPDREVNVDGVAYIRLPRENYALMVVQELTLLQHNDQHYDLIHVFNRPRDLLLYKTAMPLSRFVVSLHNEMFNKSKISYELGILVVQAVDKIITVSDYIGQTISARFPAAKRKIKTVYSGVNLQRHQPVWSAETRRLELKKKYNLEHKKVILFVGRLSKVKGPDILIKAMSHVIQQHSDAVLLIVGSKWFSDDRMDEYTLHLRQIAELLGKDRVIFTNFVVPKDIPEHYLLSDIFVCSSQWQEPLARVHYEAMGTGLPIVTTRRGGNAEIIHHQFNGLVIDDYANPLAFVEAISYLLSNPEAALQMAREGRKLAEQKFGFEHVAKRLEHVYLTAMRKKKSDL